MSDSLAIVLLSLAAAAFLVRSHEHLEIKYLTHTRSSSERSGLVQNLDHLILLLSLRESALTVCIASKSSLRRLASVREKFEISQVFLYGLHPIKRWQYRHFPGK